MSGELATWWAGQTLPAIEWVACGLSLGYVYLAGRNSVWCWPLAFVGSSLWAYQVWTAYDLLFDTVLNAFYAAMAVAGFAIWLRDDGRDSADGAAEGTITAMTPREHAAVIGGGAVLSVALTWWAARYTAAALPGPDAVTTVYSVLGTFLLIGRRLENWLYFIVIDVAYVWIYLERGSVVFAATFAAYTLMAGYGYVAWRARLRAASI